MNAKNFFKGLTFQRKLLVITLTICAAVLFLAGLALIGFQIFSFRSNFKRDTATLAAIVANNSTAAMAFKDRKAAREILSSLKAKPTVVCVSLANARGEVVARFGEKPEEEQLSQYPVPGQFRFMSGHLLYAANVDLDGKCIGHLYLRTDYHSVFVELLRFYGLVLIVVMVGCSSLAFMLSKRLGRIVTVPVLDLAETARLVGEKHDYSVRSKVAARGDELGVLAGAFNHMLGRIQSQDAALSLSQQKLESLVNSIDGIVWEWNPHNSEFTFVSQQCSRILGYEPDRCLGDPHFWNTIVHPDDARQATQSRLDAIARPQPYYHENEYRMVAADQRVVWIHESAVVLVENGRPVAFRGIFQDITERKRAAEEMVKLNQRLIETSRQAGMAEVATSVLHNVGNVLNSVNVSVTLLSDELHQSSLKKLRQATGMVREHLPKLAAYLTSDKKGKLLPEFLIMIAEELEEEHTRWRSELRGLRKNVEHIKEIVAMQQSYARVSGVVEALPTRDLVEDALRINSGPGAS